MKKIIILTAIAILANACVTQKKRSDISPVKKFYHDVTSEFNGYFNATELYNASVLSLSEQNPENYSRILPVYPYVEVENPAAVASDMDEAIKKVTIVAALHDPSHWVDDCYLLAGKAQYLKQDYEAAEETLEYLVAEFSPEALLSKEKKKANAKPKTKKEREKVKKERDKERKEDKKEREQTAKEKKKEYERRKKEKSKEIKRRRKARKKGRSVPKTQKPEEVKTPEVKPEVTTPKKEEDKKKQEEEVQNNDIKLDEPTGPFKHKPIHQEAQLWLAKTYIERDKFDQAAYLLRQLNNKDNLYPEVARELPIIQAHFAFKQQKQNESVAHLEKAIELTKDRKEKARFNYILAQLNEENGNNGAAYTYYEQVVKLNPAYEMQFSAQMSMLLNKYRSGSSSKENTIKDLEKLIKDEKNIDYLDRIYFAIAEIYLENNEETEGVKYLELALQQGTTNKAQQAESFLKLARIYYEKLNYVKASEYFNQALPNISKKDDRYPEIERLSSVLKEIAARIVKVDLQDSLIRVGQMTPEEKRALAFDIKKRQDEERRQQIINNALNAKNSPSRRPNATSIAGAPAQFAGNKSSFWAYDDRNVKRGKRDFQKQWGTRNLSDNWRRSSSQGIADDIDEEEEEEDLTLSNSKLLTDEQVANILRGVPQSKQQIEAAKIAKYEAMFELGVLYRERLENLEKAIETLEKLLREFPETRRKAEALYNLHLAHKDLGRQVNAQRYLDQLIKEFPDSPFTKVLTDPNYAQKVDAEERELNDFYDQTYQRFSEGKYQEAHNLLQQVNTKFGRDNVLQARFALLNAMTEGNLQGKDAYIKELRNVVAKYPKTDEQKRAREILRLLGASTGSPIPGGGGDDQGVFKYQPNTLHYMLIVLDPEVALTDAKVKVAEFNRKYHQSDKLRISNIYLTPAGAERIPLIVVRRFKNGEEAMQYYKNVELNSGDFVQDSDYLIYPVTQENYRQILKKKSVSGYDDFFEANYK
ncbi:MAG: tetratricopeptide repeat protein [Bacteroidota bacterium]